MLPSRTRQVSICCRQSQVTGHWSPTTPSAFTVLAHSAFWSLMNCANSCGDLLGRTMAPPRVKRSITHGSASTVVIVLNILSTTGFGVPVGRYIPCHEPTVSSGKPDSANVGTSGSCGTRVGATTASTRSLPVFMCGMNEATVTIVDDTSPASTAVVAAPAPPLYGTWTMLMPALLMNTS